MVHPDEWPRVEKILAAAAAGIAGQDEELRLLHADGRVWWGAVSWQPVVDAQGHLAGHRATVRDISKRKTAQEAMLASELRYRALFSHMQTGFALHEIITDTDGHPIDYRFLAVNPAFLAMLGRSGQDIIGSTLKEVFPDAAGAAIERIAVYGEVACNRQIGPFRGLFVETLQRWTDVTAYGRRRGSSPCC